MLTLVLLDPNVPAFANNVDLDQLASRSQLFCICTFCQLVCEFLSKTLIEQPNWLTIRSGRGFLIYSAWQGLRILRANENRKGIDEPI